MYRRLLPAASAGRLFGHGEWTACSGRVDHLVMTVRTEAGCLSSKKGKVAVPDIDEAFVCTLGLSSGLTRGDC